MYEKLFQLQEEVLKSLASQKRLEIIQLLSIRELTVSEMVEMLGISQTNLSQHLSVMRKLKLVIARKDGLYVHYCLADPRVAQLITELREFIKSQFEDEPDVAAITSLDEQNIYPLVKDPVCGMRMSPREISETKVVTGQRYYFCAAGCLQKFEANPATYVPMTITNSKNNNRERVDSVIT